MTSTPFIKTKSSKSAEHLVLAKTIANNLNELQILCDRMERFGGNWMRIQAEGLRAADPNRRLRTLVAFPEIIRSYGPSSPFAS